MFKTKRFWYILLFAILYLVVAGSSFFHAIAFFGLANNSWMSIILAFAFEVGQAAVLFSLLTSTKDRSRIMPWILMTMFTLVQVIGNVFSSYKYLMLNSVNDLKYFKEPIFIWTQLPDTQATVIVTWAIGAILPIAALLLTSMITNYLSDQEEEKLKELENKESIENTVENEQREEKSNIDNEQQSIRTIEDKEGTESKDNSKDKEIEELKEKLKIHEENPLINKYSVLQMENQGLEESNKKKDEQIDELKNQLASRLDNLHGVEDEIEKLKKDLETERSLHKDISEEFPKTVEEIAKKDEEIENLKKELEELKHNDIEKNQNQLLEDSKPIVYNPDYVDKQKIENILGKEQIENNNSDENIKQIEDLIKNGVKQDNLKESHFIN